MADCFIIMPITTPVSSVATYGGDVDHFKHVLNHLFVPAIMKVDLDPIPPVAAGADIIQAKIIKNIEEADLVLCDMSTLNPNVFFELGIRTAVDKPVCMVKDDVTETVPFDTSIVNYHTYDSSLAAWLLENQVKTLANHLKQVLKAGDGNPLWRYFGLSTRAKFSDKGTGLEAKVDLIGLQLRGLKEYVERQKPREEIAPQTPSVARPATERGSELWYLISAVTEPSNVHISGGEWDKHRMTLWYSSGELTPEMTKAIDGIARLYGYTVTMMKHKPTES